MPISARVFRVVLASPSDLLFEREIAAKVISGMNLTHSPHNRVLELRRWEDCFPDANKKGSQRVLTDQLGIARADIFIGLFWNKYGSKTKDFDSGTIEEYTTAYKAWKRFQSPRLCLYFKHFDSTPGAPLTPEQQKIHDFKQRLKDEKEVLYGTFADDMSNFQHTLRNHLELQIHNIEKILPQTTGSDKVFGAGSKEMFLIYGGFVLHPKIEESIRADQTYRDDLERDNYCRFPPQKPSLKLDVRFSATTLMGVSESRSSAYLYSSSSSGNLPRSFTSVIDNASLLKEKRALDMLTLGAYSNMASLRIINDAANTLIVPAMYKSDDGSWDGRFINRKSGLPVHDTKEEGFDYGMILRIAPADHAEHVWLFCGGLGEWGTSGAAYFLAERWKSLSKAITDQPRNFAALIKVQEGSDESAHLEWLVSQPQKLPSFDEPRYVQHIRMDKDYRCTAVGGVLSTKERDRETVASEVKQ